MKGYYPDILKAFVGKTVESIDDKSTNCITFYFTDGTKIQIAAEVGSGPLSIPYFEVWEN